MLFNRSNPNISTFTEEYKLSSDHKLNLKEQAIRFTWTIEGYVDKELKNDPRFVKFLMRAGGRQKSEIYEKILDYHVCTEEDFKEFAQPTLDSERVLISILNDPKRGLLCFDWEQLSETLEIWGVSQYNDFQFIDFAVVPCQYNHTNFLEADDEIADECIWNRTQQMEYLGNLRAYVYMSEKVFQLNQYGENTFSYRSRFYQQQMDN